MTIQRAKWLLFFFVLGCRSTGTTDGAPEDDASLGGTANGDTGGTASGSSPSSGSSSGSGGQTGLGGKNSSAIDGGRNVPEDGKIAFFLGQDSDTLGAFHQAVLENPEHADFPAPSGITLYTAILPTDLHPNTAPANAGLYLAGIEGPPADQGNGDVDFRSTLDQYDDARGEPVRLAVGLYLSDSWSNCGNQPLRALIDHGESDVGVASDSTSLAAKWRGALDRLILWFKAEKRSVQLRIGYEFDGPWNCYNQDFYKAAFRYVKDRIEALGADNVATVWQAATYPDDGPAEYDYDPTGGATGEGVGAAIAAHYADWYPGDDVVDWIGISFFSGSSYEEFAWSCQDVAKPWTVPETSPRKLQEALVSFARDHEKPLMIAESAPQGMSTSELTWSCTSRRDDHLEGHDFENGGALYAAFFEDYFSFVEENSDVIRAIAYIDTNWQAQSRWHCDDAAATCGQGYWGDSRIEANADVLASFESALGSGAFESP